MQGVYPDEGRTPLLQFLRQNAPWLGAGVLLTFLSSFGQTFFISVFAGSIRLEFGLSHGEWGGIYTLGTTASAIVMVWAGGLTDRYRVRVLGSVVLVVLAVACLSMAQVSSVWMLPFVIFGLRFAGQGMSSHIAIVAMARWFVAARGRALSIAGLGFAAGEAFLPLIFVMLLELYSWRTLWIFAAAIVIAAFPVLLMLLKTERTPQSSAEQTNTFGMNGKHWIRKEVLRHWLFWLLVPVLLGPSAFNTAFFFHQVHLADTKGWAHVQLVALFPLYTSVGIVFMVISGWLIDRMGTVRLMPIYQLPFAISFALMAYTQNLTEGAIAMAVMAVGVGANSTVPNAFWAEFFGTRHLGSIKAMAASIMVLGSAIGPGLTGWLIDKGINFENQMIGISVYFLVSCGLAAIGITKARGLLPVAA